MDDFHLALNENGFWWLCYSLKYIWGRLAYFWISMESQVPKVSKNGSLYRVFWICFAFLTATWFRPIEWFLLHLNITNRIKLTNYNFYSSLDFWKELLLSNLLLLWVQCLLPWSIGFYCNRWCGWFSSMMVFFKCSSSELHLWSKNWNFYICFVIDKNFINNHFQKL
jgi:hypothetical protein